MLGMRPTESCVRLELDIIEGRAIIPLRVAENPLSIEDWNDRSGGRVEGDNEAI